jgi:hypothetical protein
MTAPEEQPAGLDAALRLTLAACQPQVLLSSRVQTCTLLMSCVPVSSLEWTLIVAKEEYKDNVALTSSLYNSWCA